MTLPEALARLVRHLLLQRRLPLLRRGRPSAEPRCRSGRASSASARRPGSTSAPRQPALVPTPAWRKQTFTRATGIDGLEPGRLDPARDRPEGPRRDAAADGALLRDDRERRQARHAARRRRRRAARRERRSRRSSCSSFTADAAARRRRRPGGARRSSATASTRRRTPPYGTSSGVFGSFPVPIAGKTGTAEKVVQLPGYPAGHLEDQSWWCGYGPADDAPSIVVCAVIENGGHGGDRRGAGGAAGLRAVLRRQGAAPRLW